MSNHKIVTITWSEHSIYKQHMYSRFQKYLHHFNPFIRCSWTCSWIFFPICSWTCSRTPPHNSVSFASFDIQVFVDKFSLIWHLWYHPTNFLSSLYCSWTGSWTCSWQLFMNMFMKIVHESVQEYCILLVKKLRDIYCSSTEDIVVFFYKHTAPGSIIS